MVKAQALICDEQQAFQLAEVELPEVGAGQMLVRNLYSGVSIGTEFALVRGNLSWGPYPLCTGYQAVGVVERIGEGVTGYAVGDRVYHRGNNAGMSWAAGEVSSVTGGHASMAVVDIHSTHGVAPLPGGVDLAAASLFVMPAVGLNGVDMANPRMGQVAVVYGAGLIGLGVVAAAAHRGCVVVAVDIEPARLAVARTLGADHVILGGADRDVAAEVKALAPDGADAVFECTGLPACIDQAVALCRTHGTLVLQGNYGQEPISYHFLPAHGRRLTVYYPCDDGLAPCRRAVIKNMARGALRWQETITHRVEPGEAPSLYEAIGAGRARDVLGAVIRWAAPGVQ